jgi:hypothetical protein
LRAVVRVSGPGSRAAAERLLALREPTRGVHRVRVRHAAPPWMSVNTVLTVIHGTSMGSTSCSPSPALPGSTKASAATSSPTTTAITPIQKRAGCGLCWIGIASPLAMIRPSRPRAPHSGHTRSSSIPWRR